MQAPGAYRLTRRDDGALLGHTTPAQGWKRYLHPPEVRLFRAAVSADGVPVVAHDPFLQEHEVAPGGKAAGDGERERPLR
mgnify:CR=1 FL=1